MAAVSYVIKRCRTLRTYICSERGKAYGINGTAELYERITKVESSDEINVKIWIYKTAYLRARNHLF